MVSIFSKFIYFDDVYQLQMVDVGGKVVMWCMVQVQVCVVFFVGVVVQLYGVGYVMFKGVVFIVVNFVGVMGVKVILQFILLCYLLVLDKCYIDIVMEGVEVCIVCMVFCEGCIGVEMEVFIGVSVVVLILYDMCKVMLYDIVIVEFCLLGKIGGKSDFDYWQVGV